MHRIAPSRVLRFIASIPVVVLLTQLSPAAPQQKPTPPPPSSKTQLEDRVKELETRLNAAEQKASSAAMEKNYITRVQKQYEAYYEKAFNTQILTLTILGIVIGLVGKFGLDRVVQHKLSEASAQLRTEFSQLLEKETQALRESNAAQLKALEEGLTKRITKQEEDLQTRSNYQFSFAQGLAAGADERYAHARTSFRDALEIYKSDKTHRLFQKSSGPLCVRNIFVMVKNQDTAKFEENAKKELADELYNDLEDELARAAVDLTWLAPLLKERKPAPSSPAATERGVKH